MKIYLFFRYHKAARAQAPNSQALIELAKVINLDDTDNEDEISETLLISGKKRLTMYLEFLLRIHHIIYSICFF